MGLKIPCNIKVFVFFLSILRQPPQQAKASSFSRLHDHTQTHHVRQDSFGRVISPSQRPLPDNTQHLQEKKTSMPPGGIRTRNPSKRRTADPSFRPHGRWNIKEFFFFEGVGGRRDPTRVMASSFLSFLDHTQQRTTVGSTPLDQ